jgi:hypothetical protein
MIFNDKVKFCKCWPQIAWFLYLKLTETCPCPLNEDCKRRVSLESRYGTWDALPSLSFPITFKKEPHSQLQTLKWYGHVHLNIQKLKSLIILLMKKVSSCTLSVNRLSTHTEQHCEFIHWLMFEINLMSQKHFLPSSSWSHKSSDNQPHFMQLLCVSEGFDLFILQAVSGRKIQIKWKTW